ncbi:hypothetical protein GN956_G21258 [Arapaima gigas]
MERESSTLSEDGLLDEQKKKLGASGRSAAASREDRKKSRWALMEVAEGRAEELTYRTLLTFSYSDEQWRVSLEDLQPSPTTMFQCQAMGAGRALMMSRNPAEPEGVPRDHRPPAWAGGGRVTTSPPFDFERRHSLPLELLPSGGTADTGALSVSRFAAPTASVEDGLTRLRAAPDL